MIRERDSLIKNQTEEQLKYTWSGAKYWNKAKEPKSQKTIISPLIRNIISPIRKLINR